MICLVCPVCPCLSFVHDISFHPIFPTEFPKPPACRDVSSRFVSSSSNLSSSQRNKEASSRRRREDLLQRRSDPLSTQEDEEKNGRRQVGGDLLEEDCLTHPGRRLQKRIETTSLWISDQTWQAVF